MLRLGWNQKDDNYIAGFSLEGNSIYLLDIRIPSIAIGEIVGHAAPVNCFSWAPHSSFHLASGSDDHQALIWDIGQLSNCGAEKVTAVSLPKLQHTSERPVSQLSWSALDPNFIATTGDDLVTILRI